MGGVQYPHRPIDICEVLNATALSRNVLATARRIADDPDKVARLAKSLCVRCYYYSSRAGGATCTSASCGICKFEMHFANTCVDRLCHGCAAQHELCKHCGADLSLKNRRKLLREIRENSSK